MFNVENIRVAPGTPIRAALRILDASGMKIIIVTDDDRRVIGTCTDGDIRRALLRDVTLDSPVEDAMNWQPHIAHDDQTHADIRSMMCRESILSVPVVDECNRLVSLVSLSEPNDSSLKNVPIILMAGGLGKRLRPLTDNCPKPMLQIAGQPLLERIILRFKELGFGTFFISINYLGHQIEEYFGSGRRHGVNISYLRENKRLGTAGALSLLPENIRGPMIVMNGDLITEFDFRTLSAQHIESGAVATMCTRDHRTSIPFGVVEHSGSQYERVVEKPTLVHQINAGVYCLSAEALSHIPHDQFYDMPSLFEDLASDGRPCRVHKISDFWHDIGTVSDYERAQSLFAEA